jgi:hypothetical protein
MKRIAGSLALALLLLAAPAEARRVYVSPVGDDSSTTFTSSSGTPLRTFEKAINSKARTGDTLMLAHSAGVHHTGKYADAIAPNVYWKVLESITVIGDSAKPNAVVVPSVNVNAGSSDRRFGNWSIIGVRVHGNVDVYEAINLSNNDADGFQMRRCIVRNSVTVTDVDARFFRVTIGLGPDSSSGQYRGFANTAPMATRIDSCDFACMPATAAAYPQYAFAITSEPGGNNATLPNTVTASGNRFYIGRPHAWDPGDGGKPTIFRGFTGSRFNGNKWVYRDSSGFTSSGFGILFRDDWNDNVFNSDTFYATTCSVTA